MPDGIPASIPILDSGFSYCAFYLNFLCPNAPCLFTEIHTRLWPARLKWAEDSLINVDEIMSPFKGYTLSVADCHRFEYGTHPVVEMKTEQYLAYWKSLNSETSKPLLYLKDWHYFRRKNFQDFYTLPEYFSSDWLNEFSDFRMDCDDDFRFVYIGPKHTWTPLHSDVYCSYSWSANIVGKKRWWFLPPGEEKKLNGFSCGSPLPDLRDQTLASPGEEHSDLPRCYVFDQQPGEIFFVPSGWYHQVVNMTDCVSINNNWLNACNIGLVWQHLQSQLKEVKRSCADVQSTPGWDEACQECLKAWEGWDFAEFFLLLKYIIISRWLFLTPKEVRQRLPRTTVSTSPDTKVTFSQLETQVDTLFSETAEADKTLLDWLVAGSWSDDVWKRCLVSGDSVQGVRQHDLIEAARTMKSMLGNEDVRRLSLHTRGPAAWIWKDWPVFTQN